YESSLFKTLNRRHKLVGSGRDDKFFRSVTSAIYADFARRQEMGVALYDRYSVLRIGPLTLTHSGVFNSGVLPLFDGTVIEIKGRNFDTKILGFLGVSV